MESLEGVLAHHLTNLFKAGEEWGSPSPSIMPVA